MQEFLVTSIDIGSEKISSSCGISKKEEEVEILGSSCIQSKGIEKGEIIDLDKCREQVLLNLSHLEKKVNKSIENIYIGIPSLNVRTVDNLIIKKIEGKIESNYLEEIIREMSEEIPLSEEEEIFDISVDYYKLNGEMNNTFLISKYSNELEISFTINICKKSTLKKYRTLFEGTKYNILGFIVNIMSLRKIFLFNNEIEGSEKKDKVIVESGAGLTEIGIFKNGKFKDSYTIPLGGENITSDISICAGLKYDEAEDIKKKFSSSYISLLKENGKELDFSNKKIHKELFYKVCEARIEEILKYVKNKLKNTGNYNDIYSIILCSDSLTNFESIDKQVKEVMDDKVIIVKSKEFGMKDFSNITSLAIVKEIHDRGSMIYPVLKEEVKDSTLNFEEVSDINIAHEWALEESSEKEDEKKKKSIRGKLRSLLEEIF